MKNTVISIIFIFILQMFQNNLFALTKDDSHKKENRIVLIGIDAAGWHSIKPLLEKNKLPNLNFLLQDASFGRLSTVLGGAPLQWTSLATGRSSKEHGITGYYRFPHGLNSKMRECEAVWNILSKNDIKVGIAGWWATWPAEEVNGYMISNYTKYRAEPPDDIESTQRKKLQLTYTGTIYLDKKNILEQTYPRKFYFEIEAKIKEKEYTRDKEILLRFQNLQKNRQKFFDIKWNYIANEIFTDIGISLLKKHEINFISFVMYGIDVAFHRNNRETPNLLNDYYTYIDEKLGECLGYFDKNTTVIIVSEHGHEGGVDHVRKEIDGIVIIKGPKIKKNYAINNASILDITPTILYLFDLNIPSNMKGKVLTDILEDDYVKKLPPILIDTHGNGNNKQIFSMPMPDDPFDDAIYERLEKIGYFQ
jgi:predicted AlkP superfamily phosphohydrolase/phosphomutase